MKAALRSSECGLESGAGSSSRRNPCQQTVVPGGPAEAGGDKVHGGGSHKPYLAIVPSPALQWTNNLKSAPEQDSSQIGMGMAATHSELLESVPLPWAKFRTQGVIDDG